MKLTQSGLLERLAACVLLLVALSASSCATSLKPSVHSTDVNSNTSVIFGRSELVFDGLPIDYKNHFIVHHISPYISDEKISQNPFKAGEYAFRAEGDDQGYFAVALPPGRYYFVEFIYIDVIPGLSGMAGARTYMGLRGTRVRKPYVITFDVPANRATYIGTVRHAFKKLDEDPSSQWVNYVISAYSDFDKASRWFLKSRESLVGSVVEGTAVSAPFNPGK